MVVQCDVHGETALLTASWDDRVPLLRWLWEHSASASREARQAALCRAIFYACDNGQVQALAVLLSWYAGSMELEQCVVDGRTCLEKVILYGHEECFSLLVGPKYRFRVTVAHLRLAVRLGRVGMMHTFLPAHPLLLKTTCWGDKRGVRSILHVSIAQCQPGKQEHLEYLWCLINLLVDHKHMDVLQSKDDEGKDPLALSIQVKNFPLAAVLDDPLLTCRTVQDIKNLLASGNCTSPALAAARSKPPKGWTPLHTSCALGRLEVVQHLLQQTNVNVTAATANGMTALHWAARHGHTGIVGELLAAHNRQTRKPTATAACKMTPLHHAARYGHVEIVQALLTTGRYDVNAVDEELQTPLFTATAAGQARVVSVLAVAAGIALDGLTSAHETCLQRACLDQRDDLVAMLVEAGAQGGVTHPETGETALHYAASCGFGSTPGVVILQQLFDRGDSTAPDQTLLSVLLQCAVAAHEDELLWQPAPASEFPVIDFLVRRGAALTQLDDTGQTILERAQHPTLRLFLEARRDVDSECGTHTMYL
jgi:ankyrin repeat protein